MRAGVGGQGHEDDILFTGLGDLAACDYAARIGEENDLEEYFGVVGWSAGFIVLEPVVENGEIKLVVDQMIQGVFKGAALDLLFKENRDKFALGI